MKTPVLLILGLILGIVILGIATLQTGVLVLSIPLTAYLFAAILRRPEAVQLLMTREIYPDHAPQGEPITVKLTIQNQGPTIDEVVIKDLLPDGVIQVEGESSTICFLPQDGKTELEYIIKAQRGEYSGYEVLLSARDFLNFFELPTVYRTSPHLIIHPRYPKLDRIRIRPPQTRGFAGPIPSRQGGTGIDFWGIREFQTGDPQRQINWRLAARSEQELYVNIFEQERVADVGVILDARQRTNVITPAGSLFEHAVRAAAAAAENFLDEGNRVSLLIYGSGIARVFPGYGRMQRERILRELAKASPGLNYALENLALLPTRFFPAKSQIVLVSALLSEDIPVIVRIRAYGYGVLIISPDPVAFEAASYRDFTSPAYRIAQAERQFILSQLQQSGVRVVNWQVSQPLEIAVRETLARHPLVVHRSEL